MSCSRTLPRCPAAPPSPIHITSAPDCGPAAGRPPATALGTGETWDTGAVQKEFNVRLAEALAEGGITWEPGSPCAVLTGVTPAGAATTWSHAIERMERFLDVVTTQAAAGRPSGGEVRPRGAPGAAWVTAISPEAIPLP
jgi:hypothetical protein